MEYGKTRVNEHGEMLLPTNLRDVFGPNEILIAEREDDTIIIRKSSVISSLENDYDNRYNKIEFHSEDLIAELEPF